MDRGPNGAPDRGKRSPMRIVVPRPPERATPEPGKHGAGRTSIPYTATDRRDTIDGRIEIALGATDGTPGTAGILRRPHKDMINLIPDCRC